MFENISKQIVDMYSPVKIVLFGSYAKGTARVKSDIDLCIIVDVTNKRQLLTEMYCNIHSDKPMDLLLYTPDEWAECVADPTSFAYKIYHEGVSLYG